MKDRLQYASDVEVRVVVEKFEQCQFSLEEFDHAHHLTVGMAFLWQSDFEQALERLRQSLKRFLHHHGRMGYNETITRFWLLLLDSERREFGEGQSMWRALNHAIEKLGRKELLFEHYSRECALSDAAKSGWVAPDLKAITPAKQRNSGDSCESAQNVAESHFTFLDSE